jgi:hypothetical protein
MMSLHALFGRHSADLKASRWDNGRFVTDCLICGREMIKHPAGAWQIATRR